MQIILFGCPGSGKNFVGKILKNHFGFFFYDGDDLLTQDMKEIFKAAGELSPKLAKDLIEQQNYKFNELKGKYDKLAIAQVLAKRVAQERFIKIFPNAIFIKIHAPKELIIQRVKERESDFVGINLTNKIINAFEEPTIPHHIITNDGNKEKILLQLNKILNITQ